MAGANNDSLEAKNREQRTENGERRTKNGSQCRVSAESWELNLKSVEEIKAAIEAAVPGAGVEFVQNPSPSAQHSLCLAPEFAVEVATFLRDDAELAFDFLSNVSGVDWPDKEIAEKVKVTRQVVKMVDGAEQTVEETVEETRKHVEPGCLEAVYHLYSIEKKHGPLVLRMRTVNRSDQVDLPTLTPVWRSAEFQEREVFDLYGIVFTGHPDLRRLLMWDEFKDHPMRKDYVEPDDFEYEPTPHDEVLKRAQEHRAAEGGPGNSQ
jgi:NADH-quinone oxidoreductase subunit C